MTRRSKREIERAVDGLDDGGDDLEDTGGAGILVYATNDGGYVDGDGRAVDDLGHVRDDGGPIIVLQAEYAYDPPAGVADE